MKHSIRQKRRAGKGLAVFLSAVMASTGVPVNTGLSVQAVQAAEGDTETDPAPEPEDESQLKETTEGQSADCGTGVTYTFAAGTLTISGSGTVSDSFFSGKTNIVKVVIGNDVAALGKSAFQGCTGITSVEFTESSKLQSIPADCFKGCTSLTFVSLPKSIQQVSNNAFGGCGLQKIEIKNPDITSIASGYAFENCTGITEIDYWGSESQWKKLLPSGGSFVAALETAKKTYHRFAVTYDAGENGGTIGTGSDTVQIEEYSENTSLKTSQKTADASADSSTAEAAEETEHAVEEALTARKTGYKFLGWNTDKDATEALASYTVTTPDKLFAVFAKEITAKFPDAKADGGSSQEIQTAYAYNKNTTVTITAPEGTDKDTTCKFIGWSTSKTSRNNLVSAGDTVTLNVGTDYYAVYEQTVTVSYESGIPSGSDADSTVTMPAKQTGKRYYIGNAVIEQPQFTLASVNSSARPGYQFINWTKDSSSYEAGQFFTPDNSDTQQYTFTAKWQPLEAEAPQITSQPSDVTVAYGYNNQTMQVTATAAKSGVYDSLEYQWYQVKDGGTDTKVTDGTASRLSMPSGKDASTQIEYYCVITATRTDNGERASIQSNRAVFTVEKAERTLSIQPLGKYFDNKAITVENSDYTVSPSAAESEEPVITYYTDNSGSIGNSIAAPSVPGNYWVRIAFAPTENYKAITAEQRFAIRYLPTPSGTLYTLTKLDGTSLAAGNWSSSNVTIKAAEGYSIAKDSYTSTFGTQIIISDEGEQTVDIYVKKTTGDNQDCITDKISIPIKIDTTAPTGTIQVQNHIWNLLMNPISFNTFFNETQIVSIQGNDSASGIQSIEYYDADSSLIEDSSSDSSGDGKTSGEKLDEVINGKGGWKQYIGGVSIRPDKKCVIYGKITDRAGNVCYLSSDGMVFDNQPPVLEPSFNDRESIYSNDNFTFTVTDSYLDSVTVDGKKYTNDGSGSASDAIGSFNERGTFTGSIQPDNKTHSISAKDKAGNQILVKTVGLYTVNTVTFELNGGINSSISTNPIVNVDYNQPVAQPSNPTKTGYNFQGWVTDGETGTTVFDFSKGITGNITLTAIWKAKEYPITFNSQGGTACAEGKVAYNGNYPALPKPEKAGYKFGGWFTNSDCTVTVPVTHTQDSGITLYAKWTPETYTISFESAGGTECTSISVTYGQKYFDATDTAKKIPVPTRTGYQFTGWYTAENGGTLIVKQDTEQALIPAYDIAGNSTLYAHWKALKYDVQLNYQDDISVSQATVEPNRETQIMVTYGGKYDSLPVKENITRSGYTFDGWFTKESGGAQILNDTTVTESADKSTLYAHWTAHTYTVTKDYQMEGAEKETVPVTFEQTYPDLGTPTREGYTLDGWFTKKSGGTKIIESTEVTTADNHTVYAHWTPKTYQVTLDDNTGSETSSSTTIAVTFDAAYTDLSVHSSRTRTGYTFDGWYTEPSGGTKVTESTKVTTADNHILYAHWTPKTYQVTLDAGEGHFGKETPEIKTKPKDVTYDQPYPIADWEKPNRKGYTFDHWKMVSSSDTGSSESGEGVSGGEASTDTQTEIKADTIVKTADNHTLIAVWTANKYTVTLKPNGGTFVDGAETSFEVTYDAVYPADKLIVTPDNPGYTLAGWHTDKTEETQVIGGTTKVTTAGDHNLYAHWTANVLTFTGGALADAKYGESYTAELLEPANGTGNYKYSVKIGSSLPEGLHLSVNGTISGICKADANTYSFTVIVEDTKSHQSVEATFTITVRKGNQSAPNAPRIASKTSSSVTLYAEEGLEYGYCIKTESAGGDAGTDGGAGTGSGAAAEPAITWTGGDISEEGKITFTSLLPGQTYLFYAKKIATESLEESGLSEATEVTLLRKFTVTLDSGSQTDPSKHYKVVPADSSLSPTADNAYAYQVDEGRTFKFRVEIEKNYGKTKDFEVKVNDKKVSLDSSNGYTIYNIKQDQTVVVNGVDDAEAPTGTLTVGDKEYTFLHSTVYFNTYLNQAAAQGNIKVQASDNLSGALTIQYYLWNQKNALSKSKLESAAWQEYDDSAGIPLSTDGAYVIYVKIADAAGNVTYISSDGILYDSTAPVFEGLENGKEYPISQSGTGKSFQVKDDNLRSVSVDGVQLPVNAGGTYVIPVDGGTHTIKAVDYASNETELTNVKVYRRTYSVTMKQNDSDTGTTLSVTEGERLTEPAMPAQSGSIFAGWHTEDGELYDFNQPVTKDLTLTAEWETLTTGGEHAAKALSASSTKIVLEAVEGCTYRCSNGMSSETPVFTGLKPNTTYTFYVIDENGKAGEPITCTTNGGYQCALNTIPSTIYQGNIYHISPSVSMNGYIKLSKDPANTRIHWRTNREDIIDIVSSGDGMNGCTATIKKVPYNKNKLLRVTVMGTVYYYQTKGSEMVMKERTFKKTVNVQNLCDTVEIDLEAVDEQANGVAVVTKGAICLLEKKNVTLKPVINQNVDSNIATNQRLKWYISDKDGKMNNKGKKIARVTTKGVLKGVGAGATYVTVATMDSYDRQKKEYKVKATYPVIAQWIEKISFSSSVLTTAKKGDKLELKQSLELTPGEVFNADKMRYKWKSSDTAVASVNSKGVVTFKKAGTVQITCQPTGGWEIDASTGKTKEESKDIAASITFTVSE